MYIAYLKNTPALHCCDDTHVFGLPNDVDVEDETEFDDEDSFTDTETCPKISKINFFLIS